MKFLNAILRPFTALGEWLQDYVLLALRVIWGSLFMIAGFGKIIDIPGTAANFANLNIPFAEATAWLVACSEFFGGLLLLLGLFSRIAAIPLVIAMIGAYITVHFSAFSRLSQDPEAVFKEHPFNYLLAALIVLCFGAGKFSLDEAFGINQSYKK